MDNSETVSGRKVGAGATPSTERRFLSSHFLLREAGLKYRDVARLNFDVTVEKMDELFELEARRRGLRERLRSALYAAVPAAPRRDRAILVEAQRKLFDDRPLDEEAIEAGVRYLPDDLRQDLRALVENWRAHLAALESGDSLFRREGKEKRRLLAHLLRDGELQKAVQLSQPTLLRNLLRYARHVSRGEEPTKRLRKIETSLVGYIYRMALKPSPFGSFTTLRLGFFGKGPEPTVGDGSVRRVVRIARLVLMWVERVLADDEEIRRHLPVRLNGTCRVIGDRVGFFTRGPDGTPGAFSKESFRTVRDSPSLRAVLDYVRPAGKQTGTITFGQLAARLEEASGVPGDGERYLGRLVDVGLLECDLDIPDQVPDFLEAVREKLKGLPEGLGARVDPLIERASRLERAFSSAEASDRARMSGELSDVLEDFASLLGTKLPPLNEARTLFYEDVGVYPPLAKPPSGLSEAAVEDLALIQRLLPLFDPWLEQRELLQRVFRQQYQPTDTPDLLEFYRAFSIARGNGGQQRALESPGGATRAIGEGRERFFDHIDRRLRLAPEVDEIRLERDWVEALVQGFASGVYPWESATYGCQVFEDSDGSRRFVINSAEPGFARRYSRFCDLFGGRDEASNPLVASIRCTAERLPDDRARADLLAVLGLNLNLHPNLLPYEILYPGCVSEDASSVITLEDLCVRYDASLGRIGLFSKRLGRPVEVIPLNFLLPLVAPPLYRFLCTFGPSIGWQSSLWDAYDARRLPAEGAHVRRYPRISIGDWVLDRTTWKVPTTELPWSCSAQEDFGRFLAARRWKKETGLPEQAFFRSLPKIDAPRRGSAPQEGGADGDPRNEPPNPRGRKPQYVDFRNFFLVRILEKHVQRSDADLTLQEFLPGTRDLVQDAAGGRAAEYMFELSVLGDGPGGNTR